MRVYVVGRARSHGRRFAQQLEEIFGTSDTNSGTRDLSLSEFLSSLNQSQAKNLRLKAAAAAPKPGKLGARPGAAGTAAKRGGRP